jgi:hypothetical protein
MFQQIMRGFRLLARLVHASATRWREPLFVKKKRKKETFMMNPSTNSLVGKIVCLRWIKPYVEAHNHVAVGVVTEEAPHYISLYCKTYHVGKHRGCPQAVLVPNKSVGGIIEGDKRVRHIPWSRIELIGEYPTDTEWDVPAWIQEDGSCVLQNKYRTVVTRAQDGDLR